MEHPPGFVAQESGKMYRLKKSLYGLNQSPRAWFGGFASIVRIVVFLILRKITLCFGNIIKERSYFFCSECE